MDRRSFTRLIVLASLTSRRTPEEGWARWVSSRSEGGPGFDVRRFGAKGDGTSDDSISFKNAIAAAGVRGGTVIVPDGLYVLPRALHLPSGVVLQGTGTRSIIRHVKGDPEVIVAVDAMQVGVQDLTISGEFAHGVVFHQLKGATLARCHISGGTVPRYGISGGVLIVGSTGVKVEECRFDGNGGGGYLQGADIQCDGLGATSREIRILRNECWSTKVAVNVRCFDTSLSEIRGNVIRGARILGPPNHGYGIVIYPTTPNHDSCFENVVAHNNVSQTQGTGIYLVRCHRSRVEDNVIDSVASVQTDLTLPVAGVALNQSQFVSVLRNTISNSGRAGVSVASSEPGVGHVEVRGNVITNSTGYGIHLRGILQDIHVISNQISRANGGIGGDTADQQDNIEITDNVLTAITGRAAIKLGNASHSTVARNAVRDATNYGLDLEFRDDVSVATDNVVQNAGTTWGKGGDSVRVMRKGKLER